MLVLQEAACAWDGWPSWFKSLPSFYPENPALFPRPYGPRNPITRCRPTRGAEPEHEGLGAGRQLGTNRRASWQQCWVRTRCAVDAVKALPSTGKRSLCLEKELRKGDSRAWRPKAGTRFPFEGIWLEPQPHRLAALKSWTKF